MKNFIFIIFIAISNCLFGQHAAVSVTGSWDKSFNELDITDEGNDYAGTYESMAAQTVITITSNNQHKPITVYVNKKIDVTGEWHPNLDLQIKRTDNNNNNSTGGLAFQTITDNNSVFFYTKGWENKVPIQYRINGISVLLPVQDYTTTIYFTVTQ